MTTGHKQAFLLITSYLLPISTRWRRRSTAKDAYKYVKYLLHIFSTNGSSEVLKITQNIVPPYNSISVLN